MTTTRTRTFQDALDEGNLNQLDTILKQMKLGTMLTPLKRTFTGLASAAAQNLTTIDGTGETTGTSNPKRLAALAVITLRVTAGAAAAGHRNVTDAAGTPAATLATLSDDGKTVTFEAGVTAFVITYIPRSSVDMTSGLPITAP